MPTYKIFTTKRIRIFLYFLLLYLFLVGVFHTHKMLPSGTNFSSKTFIEKSNQVDFLYDLSYLKDGKIVREQMIFDTILDQINKAEKYILIDMFLFNSLLGNSTSSYRQLSEELTQALIFKKKENPGISIDFISDPINTSYGGARSDELDRLGAANINVITTNLAPLKDSNPIYSSMWRTFFSWFGAPEKGGWLKNPFGNNGEKVGFRSWLKLLNFKANHRKIFVCDSDNTMVSIVSSANPHDGSSAHSNVAIKIVGDFWQGLWLSESAVANMSNAKLSSPPLQIKPEKDNQGDANIAVELITEGKIRDSILESIRNTEKGDQIKMAMFYLAEREIVKSLLSASERGVDVKIVLDPNKDAFGYEKIGIPNRQVANELVKKSDGKIQVRWYSTHGEQFHSKITYIGYKNGPSRIILGSANLTRRNINNYNLESNVSIIAPSSTVFSLKASRYFDRIWNNENNEEYTIDYSAYEDKSQIKYLIYRLQEASGLSSF